MQNAQIMKVIWLTLAFPMVAWIYLGLTRDEDIPEVIEIFDTTTVAGYTYFRQYDIDINEQSNIILYNVIFPLIGTPHRSRDNRNGLDCSALVKRVYQDSYNLRLMGSSRDIYRMATEVSQEELMEADLIFFKINSSTINHVGIYLNNGKFVHASSTMGVEINDISNPYYRQFYYKAARLVL